MKGNSNEETRVKPTSTGSDDVNIPKRRIALWSVMRSVNDHARFLAQASTLCLARERGDVEEEDDDDDDDDDDEFEEGRAFDGD